MENIFSAIDYSLFCGFCSEEFPPLPLVLRMDSDIMIVVLPGLSIILLCLSIVYDIFFSNTRIVRKRRIIQICP